MHQLLYHKTPEIPAAVNNPKIPPNNPSLNANLFQMRSDWNKLSL